VDVAALLSPQLLTHLRVVLGRGHRLHPVEGWSELARILRTEAVDLLVADPGADGHVRVAELQQLIRQFPSVPVVIYTALSPATMKAVVQLARVGVEHVVLNRFDDEPRRFKDLLEGVPGHALADQMLRQLAGPLAGLPIQVSRAVEQLFRSPGRFRSTDDLAAAAGMNKRTLYRNLEPVGFFSPRLLVVAARLLRVYAHLRDPGRQIKEISDKVGYHSPWQLTQQMREVTGHTPRTVRRRVGADEFIALLARRVYRPAVKKNAHAGGRRGAAGRLRE
jgi:AraC-like DNA-binding protein